MEVIVWQLLVFCSVAVITASMGSRAGLLAALAWSVWTLMMLFHGPLVAIQLAVAWGAWAIFKSLGDKRDTIRRQEEKIAALEAAMADALKEYTDTEQRRIRAAANSDNTEVIKDSQHSRELERAVEATRERLVISSGWISDRVVNRGFCKKLDDAMQRGVAITIYYGWQSYNQRHEPDRSARNALSNLDKLKSVGEKKSYRGSLAYYEVATHEKLLLVDDKYAVVGSFNWLSNKGLRNAELSIKIHDAGLTRGLRAALGGH